MEVLGPVSLGHHPRGSHSEKAKDPVDHVEDCAPDGNGSYVGWGSHVPNDGGVNHREQWHSDIADDGRKGQPEDFSVQWIFQYSASDQFCLKVMLMIFLSAFSLDIT